MSSKNTSSKHLTIDTSYTSKLEAETELYSIAKVAYDKLVSEAATKDQNLRRLVGHANLYDKLSDEYYSYFSDSDSDTSEDEATSPTHEEHNTIHHVEVKEAGYCSPSDVWSEDENGIEYEMDSNTKDLGLRKVPSHSQEVAYHVTENYSEVEVGETEIFDDDWRVGDGGDLISTDLEPTYQEEKDERDKRPGTWA